MARGERVGIAGIHSAHEWRDETIQNLAPQATADERAQTLVTGGVIRAAADKRLSKQPPLGARR